MIRKLLHSDREKIIDILIRTKHFSEEEIRIATELLDVYLENKSQEDYIIYVYENNGRTAGYICYGKRPLTNWTYDLYWIAVDPEVHGKGIGSELIRYMEKDLISSGAKIILIETSGRKEYENERKFYEKNRYEVQTIIKDFYREADDLYVYRKYL